MRARRRDESGTDYLTDALALLAGWTREGREIKRTLRLDVPRKLQGRRHIVFTDRIHRTLFFWLTAKS